MSKKLVIAALLALSAGLVFAWYLWVPAGSPAGQPALVHIDAQSYAQFKSAFNDARSTVRVVALLSPT